MHDAKVALGERGLAWWRPELDAADLADRIGRAPTALTRAGVDSGELPTQVAAVTSRPDHEVATVLRAADRRARAAGRRPFP